MHEVLVPAHPGTSMCKSVAVTSCLQKEIKIVPTVQALPSNIPSQPQAGVHRKLHRRMIVVFSRFMRESAVIREQKAPS